MAKCSVCGKPLPEGHFGQCEDCIKAQYKNPSQKGLKIDVKVDSDAIRAKEAELDAKLKEAEEGKKLFDEMKSKVESWYAEKGLQSPNITDKDSLTNAIKNLDRIEKLEQNQKPYKEPSGQAPLSPEQISGRSRLEGEYGSTEELIDDIRSKAHQGDKTAQLILDRLFEKALKGAKQGKQGITEYIPEPMDTEIQRLKRNFREKRLREAV